MTGPESRRRAQRPNPVSNAPSSTSPRPGPGSPGSPSIDHPRPSETQISPSTPHSWSTWPNPPLTEAGRIRPPATKVGSWSAIRRSPPQLHTSVTVPPFPASGSNSPRSSVRPTRYARPPPTSSGPSCSVSRSGMSTSPTPRPTPMPSLTIDLSVTRSSWSRYPNSSGPASTS